MPSQSQLATMGKLSQTSQMVFSAAAHAVMFLTAIHPDVRACLHRVVLNEAHASIGSLHGYASGLIPFCKGNPKLRIERRADIWRTVLTGGRPNFVQNFAGTEDRGTMDPFLLSVFMEFDRRYVSTSFRSWFGETIALSSAGMPPKSFSLVFYSDSAETTQNIVDILAEDTS
jgi:hypothetical protein